MVYITAGRWRRGGLSSTLFDICDSELCRGGQVGWGEVVHDRRDDVDNLIIVGLSAFGHAMRER